MWELDHKDGRVPKNWCFPIMVLEKTLETPLDFREIKLGNPKGSQPWILIGRTDAEAPALWPPDANSRLIGKDPDAGKDWRQKEKRVAGWDGWMASPIQWTWTWAKSRRWWGTGRPGICSPWGCKESDTTWRLHNHTNQPLSFSGLTFPTSSLGGSRNHLPGKQPAPKALSQGLLWDEPKLW